MRPIAITSRQDHIRWLALAAGTVLLLPQLPLGNYILYPLVVLSTWFHEMGHGLTALAVGFQFERLVLLANGSGLAETMRPTNASALSQALVAAGGPIGPAIVGALLILASTKQRLWRPALYALAGAIALSTLIWVRSLLGWAVLPGIAMALVLIALKAPPWLERFTLQFLGLQAALSMFQQWDYLLMERAVIGGREILSDTGAIEQYLFLPHWFWAGGIIAFAAMVIGASLRYALFSKGNSGRWDSSISI